MNKAVFFDRDGVLNIDFGYVYQKEKWQWTPGAVAAIRWCNENGYLVIVVTNQSGVARGYYSEEDVRILHEWIAGELQEEGARIDAFYVCPHYPNAVTAEYALDCECRKPQPGMLLQAIDAYDIDGSQSVLFGDKDSDIEAAKAAGVQGIKVDKNRGWQSVAEFVTQVTNKE